MNPGADFAMGPIQRARSDVQKRLRRIRRFADSNHSARSAALRSRECLEYARSPLVRRAIFSSLPRFHCWNDQRLQQLVETANPLLPCAEDVLWRPKQKIGGYRPICLRLPAQVHVGQIIGKDLINAQIRPDRRVFDWSGRGRLRYANAIAEAITREGPFVALTDIISCHQSIDPDALYTLDYLPTELIRWSLDYRNLSFRCVEECQYIDVHSLHRNPTGPRGLLQGGPASSALLTALIGRCVTEVQSAYCQNIVDNFAAVGSNTAVVQQAAGEIARIVAGYRVGRLEFDEPQVFDTRDGFDHLGFHFRLSGGQVLISPNMGNILRMMARIESRITTADDIALGAGPEQFIQAEAAAFTIMPNVDLVDVMASAEQIWMDEIERRTRL